MSDDLQRIRRFVGRLVQRERALLLWRTGLQALLLVAGLVALAVLAATLGWDRPQTAFLLVLLAGIGGWAAVFWPLRASWASAGDPVRQAARVEELAPELRGRLLTAVERIDGPRGEESPAMLALVAHRAAQTLARVRIKAVHPGGFVAKLGALVVVSYAAVAILTLLTPGGPGGVLRWWAAGTRAEAAVAGLTVAKAEDFARVGDLVIRYTYPSYTGLDPKEIPNSTGDVSGPPGTVVEVTARTGEPVEAAGLVAYDERLEAVVTEDGRQLSGRFSIQPEEGTYQLVLYRGGEPERSREFTVAVEADLPPDVMVDASSEVIEIPVDGGFALDWRARDDYGVSRVKLQVSGNLQDESLFVSDRRQAEAFGRIQTTPRRLGLKAGDEAELVVVAWDNDTVSGAKTGASRAIRLVVLGARGEDARIARREQELIEILVPILAAHLTDPWPPGDTSDAMARWGEQVARRYEPLHDAVARLWQGMSTDTYDAAVIKQVVETGNQLVRYTQVAYTPGATEQPDDASFGATAGLRDVAVVAVEDALLALIRMREARALREVAEHARDLANAAKELEQLLSEDDPDVQEMLARLDMLERMFARLQERAAKLSEGGLQEYLNQRQSEIQRLMEEVRAAIAAGDLERARELMERLQRQIAEMAEGIDQELQRRVSEGDQLGQQIQEFRDRLNALEQEQRQLQAEVQELRERTDDRASEEASKLWARLDGLAREVVEQGTAYESALKDAGDGPATFLFNEKQRARSALEDSETLRDAIGARDLRGARTAVIDADNGWLYTLRAAETRRARGGEGPAPRSVDGIREKIRQIERLLDQLDQVSQSLDPATRQRARELEQRQRQMQQEMEEARKEGRQLQQQLPVRPEGMQEALEDAGRRMEQASEDLGQGQPMQAEGSQGMAAERLREAQEALDQAMEQMAQQQRQMQQGGQEQGQQQRSEGEGSSNQSDPFSIVEIPGREEFRTPEEYRRALLEGMEGDVPEEFRALKKRYYEELVHQ